MILTYLFVTAGTGLSLWAVVDLLMADHLLEGLSQLVLVLITLYCSLAFFRRAPKMAGHLFVALSWSVCLEIAGHMTGGMSPSSFWAWIYFVFALTQGPLVLDLATRFPASLPKLRWIAYLAYAINGTVMLLGPQGLLGPVLNPMHELSLQARAMHYQGGGHTIYTMGPLLISFAMAVLSLVLLLLAAWQARRDGQPRVTRQALIITIGTLISWVPTVAFVPSMLPPGMELMLHGPPAAFFGLIAISWLAALRHPEFYDAGGLFRKVLIGLGLFSGAFLLYLLVIRALLYPLDLIQPGFAREPAVFGAALTVALLVRPMQNWITNQVDQLFFPHLLGFRSLLEEASQALATTIIPSEVAKLATESLPARLGTSGAALLVLDDLDAQMVSLAGAPLALPSGHPVRTKALRVNGPTLLTEEAQCAELGLTTPALLLPLRVGGRLVGLYLMGARQPFVNYTRSELAQLKVLGHHLAVAVENGRALRKIDALSQRALAEVEERNMIAREIHDTIAQGLTAASLQLEVVEATLTANPAKASKAAGRAQEIVRANLAEARRSVLELRAPLLGGESLPAALSRLLKGAAEDIGAAGSFQLEGSYRGVPARIENQLYRIAQEALHNAVKYSSASQLTMHLRLEEGRLSLSLADDGAGFDRTHLAPGSGRGGFGLTGMGERARLLGGQLRIVSEPGEGTLVEVIVPLERREGESA